MTKCKLVPRGWRCYLPAGHDGPCPAWPRFWRRPLLWLQWSDAARQTRRAIRRGAR